MAPKPPAYRRYNRPTIIIRKDSPPTSYRSYNNIFKSI
jgi:hypothetical protein